MWHKYDYILMPSQQSFQKLPLISVSLKVNQKVFKVAALLDSGAYTSLFNIAYLNNAGVKTSETKKATTYTAGGLKLITYYYSVEVECHKKKITIDAAFVRFGEFSFNLLGQDFFENFAVLFNQNKKSLWISSDPHDLEFLSK